MRDAQRSRLRDHLADCDALERYGGILADVLLDSCGCRTGVVLGLEGDHGAPFVSTCEPYPIASNKAGRLLHAGDDFLPQKLGRLGPLLDAYPCDYCVH